jgi:hypothetical protein
MSKAKFLLLFLLLFTISLVKAQEYKWSPYLVLTYKYTQPDGFIKTKIIVKKDSLIYQSFELGKEMLRKMVLDTVKQKEIRKLMDDHKFLSLNTRAAKKHPGANSYTYVMDKFRKVIYEPPVSKSRNKFDEFNKAFLEITLSLIFKEEMKSSWH